MRKDEQKSYKKDALRAAEELFYSQEVIDRIKASNDDREISRIMRQARIDACAKENDI